jgi:hypothetical protein
MVKYRRLTLEELESLEKEFIDYLVVNGITADDWVKLKANEVAKAERIIELFSDVVLEGALRKIEFLELRTNTRVFCYQCVESGLVLMALQGGPLSDFTSPTFIQNALEGSPGDIEIFSSQKQYNMSREWELFQMLQSGHTVSDGRLFKSLALVLAEQS